MCPVLSALLASHAYSPSEAGSRSSERVRNVPESSESGGGRSGSWVLNPPRVGAPAARRHSSAHRRKSCESSEPQASPNQDSLGVSTSRSWGPCDDKEARHHVTSVPGGHTLPRVSDSEVPATRLPTEAAVGQGGAQSSPWETAFFPCLSFHS